ncbi:hypothetical protein ACKS0A_07850 [Histoplasma ohiense]
MITLGRLKVWQIEVKKKKKKRVTTTYLNLEVRMEQNLKLKRLWSLILDLQGRSQTALAQRDTVHQSKIIRPIAFEFITQHAC